MAGSKSDRKTDATYTIFANGERANDAVRVGYIDPKRGYISGLSVYQANKYAERNPGTQFIISNRDKIRYININEVNALTNKDTLPKSNPSGLVDENEEFDPCNTVRGFRTAEEGAGSSSFRIGLVPVKNRRLVLQLRELVIVKVNLMQTRIIKSMDQNLTEIE